MKEFFSILVSIILTNIVYLFNGFDISLNCLLIAIVLDYISGTIKAFVTKKLSSKIGYLGIIKKVSILFIVMLGVLIDRVTGESGAIRTLIIYYFVANEGLSILENFSEIGIPIPEFLLKSLNNIKKDKNE
nr:MAG TPA: holin [Caudoviricetes sp.]